MSCKICGDPEASWRTGRRGFLCDSCADSTPNKIGYEEFKRRYFEADVDVLLGEKVPENIAREFYSDYRSSDLNFEEYLQSTTSVL